MTIGSVPPNINTACVRDITFRNINFSIPIKAVYIKTNPGDHGDRIIENILYDTLNNKSSQMAMVQVACFTLLSNNAKHNLE